MLKLTLTLTKKCTMSQQCAQWGSEVNSSKAHHMSQRFNDLSLKSTDSVYNFYFIYSNTFLFLVYIN